LFDIDHEGVPLLVEFDDGTTVTVYETGADHPASVTFKGFRGLLRLSPPPTNTQGSRPYSEEVA
jgi:hypothetical protein